MAVNPDQLWSTLDKIEQKLLSIVDDFDAVSQAAVALGGNVAKVLPIQLNSSADTVLALVNGDGQNSIKNLKDYVDNIPLGDLRTKSAGEAIRNGQYEAPTKSEAPAAPIDTTPHPENAPKSAIIGESTEINLDDYKKQPMKESKQLNENNEFSFDAILDDVDIDNEGYNSEIPEADTDYLESDLSDGFSDENFEDDDESFSFDDFETDRLAAMNRDEDEDPSYEDAFAFGEEFSDNI